MCVCVCVCIMYISITHYTHSCILLHMILTVVLRWPAISRGRPLPRTTPRCRPRWGAYSESFFGAVAVRAGPPP